MTPGDLNRDDDIDQDDFNVLEACVTGPNLGPPAGGCENADLDHDNDIDQSDFGIFQRCLSGQNNPADPNCGN